MIPQEQLRIGLLGDGVDWLWKHMATCFPKGRQIFDYYHCAEYIYKVDDAQYRDKSERQLEWIEGTMSRLFFAQIGSVIWGLQRMNP